MAASGYLLMMKSHEQTITYACDSELGLLVDILYANAMESTKHTSNKMNEWMNQWMDESMNQSIDQSRDRLIDWLIDK